jgi:hypothetical protein
MRKTPTKALTSASTVQVAVPHSSRWLGGLGSVLNQSAHTERRSIFPAIPRYVMVCSSGRYRAVRQLTTFGPLFGTRVGTVRRTAVGHSKTTRPPQRERANRPRAEAVAYFPQSRHHFFRSSLLSFACLCPSRPACNASLEYGSFEPGMYLAYCHK